MILPEVTPAEKLRGDAKRVFLGACGFEARSLGWVTYQSESTLETVVDEALLVRYRRPKGRNRVAELYDALVNLGATAPHEVPYDVTVPHHIEDHLAVSLPPVLQDASEVVVDISAMTKLLILVCLVTLRDFTGTVRIVYTEAADYAPTREEYEASRRKMEMAARFPSRGLGAIVRTRSLSSIRMQGQPSVLVAFTSFNEQLVRHMLGTISPHKLLLISAKPPRQDYSWREEAAQQIHASLIKQYAADNPIEHGSLTRAASTLDYRDTVRCVDGIYQQFGLYERIILAATGSKMQTVGAFFSKVKHPDLHIEYPAPDSYFVKRMSTGIRQMHEVIVPDFSQTLARIGQAGGRMEVDSAECSPDAI